jgi:hypothetical protein
MEEIAKVALRGMVVSRLMAVRIRAKARRRRKRDGKWGQKVGSRRDSDNSELTVQGIRWVFLVLDRFVY